MRLILRALAGLLAAVLVVVGLAGVYAYGQSYSQHRGFVRLTKFKRAGTGRLLDVNFYSSALHRHAFYLVYLPPGYRPTRRYPVYYLLHGMPGRPQAYIDIGNLDVRLDNQLSLKHVRPMILVFPDGRINGDTYSDSEWANTRAGNYESYVINVVRNVDRRFSTVPRRQDRVIAGLSAGAYGALNVGLHHVAVFGGIQVWSGYVLQTRTGVFAHASRALLAYNSPLDYVTRLRRVVADYPLRVFMFIGRGDADRVEMAPMVRGLKRVGTRVQYVVYPGGHDWAVWYPRLDQLLMLASYDMSHPLPVRHRLRGPHATRGHSRLPTPSRILAAPSTSRILAAPTTSRIVAAATTSGVVAPVHHGRRHRSPIGGLLLALIAAAAINLGFLLQHRGLLQVARPGVSSAFAGLRSRTWLAGQALGWAGLGGQVLAVAFAPLSLVQAFSVGGLALSVPLAAWMFRYRVSRQQALAVLVIAAALASLPVGLAHVHGHMDSTALVVSVMLASALGLAVGHRGNPALRAIGAGLLYGVADAAIKAISVNWRLEGSGALLSVWTALALLATFAGFVMFQSALRSGDAVSAISLMTALTAVTALMFGVVSFGESLGRGPAIVLVHLVAIAAALGCVPVLAGAQQDIAEGVPDPIWRPPSALVRHTLRAGIVVGKSILVLLILVLTLLVGIGLLYQLRALHGLTLGMRIGDSLPLLQLAGSDGQPLGRVAAAWLIAGAILGLALIRVPPLRRALLAGILGTLLLLLASDAAFALARNDRFGYLLWHRLPGAGPWWEGLMFALGCWLPLPMTNLRRRSAAPPLAAQAALPGPPARG